MEKTGDALYYHTIELPDGLRTGCWDCRGNVDAYLGHVDFAGKTVLEIGPANGFFTFEMERRGARVCCLELGQTASWDLVPGPQINQAALARDARVTLSRIEAAFWEAHRALKSRAVMKYGRVYDAPGIVGKHQIGMIGNVLQHLRDPIGGMMAAAECITETMIVTETMWIDDPRFETESFMWLLPRAELPEVIQSWWQVSSPLVGETLKLLGFPQLKAEYSHALMGNRPVRHMTWVGHRD